MRIVDGDRDYLLKEKDFIDLYMNDHYYTIREICKKLDLNRNQYRKLRDKCREEGTIELRPAYRPRKKKREPKFYSIAYRNRNRITYQICRRDVYYCKADTMVEAELIVEKLKECDWDKSQVPRIKKEVKKMSERTFTQEEINEITNTLYSQYIEMVRADKMDYRDLILVENVILKVQMTVVDKVNEDD